jgi:flagellar motor protein MotB
MDTEDYDEQAASAPFWPAFGDLMACLFGLFVMFFVWLVAVQVSLSEDLEEARASHEEAAQRLDQLERALAGPLASGLITLVDSRIGIRGNVLFAAGSADLSPAGRELLVALAGPLGTYLEHRGEAAMVSGFTDDRPLTGFGEYRDNWELSAQRALTVTRTLVESGIPSGWVFAAGFGSNHPIAPNDTERQRAQNRRVEIAPVPRPTTAASASASAVAGGRP